MSGDIFFLIKIIKTGSFCPWAKASFLMVEGFLFADFGDNCILTKFLGRSMIK